MKKRFTEEQIIGFLREAEAGVAERSVPAARVLGGELLPVEVEVRRHERAGGEAVKGAGGRECAAEEAAGRNATESGDHQGGVAPKVVTVPAKRELVRYAQSRGLSERRALRLARLSPSVLRYERKDDGNGPLRARIAALAHHHRRHG